MLTEADGVEGSASGASLPRGREACVPKPGTDAAGVVEEVGPMRDDEITGVTLFWQPKRCDCGARVAQGGREAQMVVYAAWSGGRDPSAQGGCSAVLRSLQTALTSAVSGNSPGNNQ